MSGKSRRTKVKSEGLKQFERDPTVLVMKIHRKFVSGIVTGGKSLNHLSEKKKLYRSDVGTETLACAVDVSISSHALHVLIGAYP